MSEERSGHQLQCVSQSAKYKDSKGAGYHSNDRVGALGSEFRQE